MKRSMWMLPIALLLVTGTPGSSAEPGNGEEARADAPKLITYDDIQFMLKKGQPYSRDQLPERIKAIDGRRIAITGIMAPLFKVEGITQFVLMRNTSRKYGTEPPCEMIVVKMAPGTSTTYKLKHVTVTGRFTLEEFTSSGKTLILYRITEAAVAGMVKDGSRTKASRNSNRHCRTARFSTNRPR